MIDINNACIVKQQYQNANNLNTRISLHEKYSKNKQGFGNWIISNYKIDSNARVLELGCGTGSMWRGHSEVISRCSELILTDFSEGMIDTAKNNLKNYDNVSFDVVDIQNIPYVEESFDVVIANMMLYHVPDLEKGLREVRRVLKENGTFYCATYGEHGIIQYIENILSEFRVLGKVNKIFTLQNGIQILSDYFESVKRMNYEDSLEVTDTKDMIEYIHSCTSLTNLNQVKEEVLMEILENHKEKGVIKIPKEYGMFICQK